jgi:hypothetical protein
VTSAAEHYASLVDAYSAQLARVGPGAPDRWGAMAAGFRLNPRRELEANTAAVAALIEPGDVVIDVGGGAGRVGLPVALRCREVVNVEPSAGMREQFEASATEASITNARAIGGAWPGAAVGLQADIVMLANVTYFVRDILPFIEGLRAAARRRVIIGVWSVPPPNHAGSLFELLHGEPQARVPSYRELLPVLWDLGLVPDVKVLTDPFRRAGERPPTREAAIEFAIARGSAERVPGAAGIVAAHFDDLYAAGADVFVPKWTPPTREMLITWTER